MELLEALEVIKGECGNHDTCHDCPLRKDNVILGKNNCSVSEINPMYWNLRTSIEIPRLFK